MLQHIVNAVAAAQRQQCGSTPAGRRVAVYLCNYYVKGAIQQQHQGFVELKIGQFHELIE